VFNIMRNWCNAADKGSVRLIFNRLRLCNTTLILVITKRLLGAIDIFKWATMMESMKMM